MPRHDFVNPILGETSADVNSRGFGDKLGKNRKMGLEITGHLWHNRLQKGEREMKISTKGRYALRLMMDLAANDQSGYVSLKDAAERQDISLKYLEQIAGMLSRAGMLQSGRGAQGGYRLARMPEQYTVGEILRLTEGNLAPVACLAEPANRCERCGECATLDFWTGLYAAVNEYIDRFTLADLLAERERKQSSR